MIYSQKNTGKTSHIDGRMLRFYAICDMIYYPKLYLYVL